MIHRAVRPPHPSTTDGPIVGRMYVFLFTDVASSTRLWEQFPAAMRAALAQHDEILRTGVEAECGEVIKTTGDGLLAVFDSAAGCVTACLDMQRALAGQPWELPEPLRVRMGVHVGEAERRGGDLYGSAVNRAARITAAGHGGQVLLSGRAADAARDALPPNVELRHLGTHRLKDLTQPEQLYQLVHPDLRAEFPPLATIDARPNNLPTQVSEFVAREAEVRAVRALLEDRRVRLVTLTGPGGTGKTRLGLQVAAEVIDHYRDGVFLVDLAAVRDADAAFETILRDLDLSGARQGSPLEVLRSQLRERRMLLVLDNFEQVTAAALGIAELLQHCPDLEVLVTSREALRLRGEHVFPVPPLALPDPRAPVTAIAAAEAVRLFTDRARSVRPDFVLDQSNAEAVAEISVRLDGLPLALELAAARLRLFSPRDLLERLRQRADALGSGARDLPVRQRTLRSTIEWSYDLLGEEERRLFELLSVFATARLEAVEEVAERVGADIDVVEALVSLVDKSLLRSTEAGGSQRFSMLQTVREYASERLTSSPERVAAARRAHAAHYSRFAEGQREALAGPDRAAALEAFSSELANLRAAWRYWLGAGDRERLERLIDGLWALFEARGWHHAAAELARDLLGLLTATDHSAERDLEEATLRASLARALMTVEGYTVEVEAQFHRALELVSSVGSGAGAEGFAVLRALASYFLNVADFPRAAAVGRQLLDLAEVEGDDTMRVEGQVVYGVNTALSGEAVEGLRHLDEAIARFDPAMHRSGRFRLGPSAGVVARAASGFILRERGHPAEGARRLAAALELAERLEHPFTLAYALYHHGFLDLTRRRLTGARECAAALGEVAAEHGYLVWQALASVLDGVALCGLGESDEGIERTEAGAALYRGLTTPPVFWPPLLALRSRGFAWAGRPDRALELVEAAIEASGDDEALFPEFRTLRGDILAASPDAEPGAAEAAYRAAIRGAEVAGLRLTELAARTGLSRLLSEQRDVDTELSELRALYATFDEGFDDPELVDARAVLEGAVTGP
jgi:predicted ATPase/class 3 adenylate cyclase